MGWFQTGYTFGRSRRRLTRLLAWGIMANTLNEKELLPDRASLALCNVDESDHNLMVNTITSPCGRAKVELLRACPLAISSLNQACTKIESEPSYSRLSRD